MRARIARSSLQSNHYPPSTPILSPRSYRNNYTREFTCVCLSARSSIIQGKSLRKNKQRPVAAASTTRVSLRCLCAFRRTDNLGRIQRQLGRNQINVFVVFSVSYNRERSCEPLTIYRNICDSFCDRIDRLLSDKSTGKQILVRTRFYCKFPRRRSKSSPIDPISKLFGYFIFLSSSTSSSSSSPSSSSNFSLFFPFPSLFHYLSRTSSPPPLLHRKKLNSSRNLTVVYLE